MKDIMNRIQMVCRGMLVFFLFYYSYIFQYIPVLLFHLTKSMLSNNLRMAVLLSTFSDLIILLLLLLIYWKDLVKEFKTFIKPILENINTGFICWGIGLFIMFASNGILVSIFHSEGANNEVLVREMVAAYPLMMGLNVCLLAPFIEEIVFRKTLKDIFHHRSFYVMASFLAFGLAHVASMATSLVDWLYIIPYGALGGVFAYADHKTDTIFTSILFHMIHNTLVFCLLLIL